MEGQVSNANKTSEVWNLIEKLKSAKGITEFIINGPDSVFVERMGDMSALDVNFSIDDINFFIQDVVNYNKKPFDRKNPLFDGVLANGYRVNMISPHYTGGFPAITIRRYDKIFKGISEAVEAFSLDYKWSEFFVRCVESRKNVIVSGGTGTGKTSFLNSLMAEIPRTQRVITIEDTRELSFDHPNTVRLESQVSTGGLNSFQLVKNALRMRPDRIIIGEIRGGEIFDLFQAMNTGHDGSMSTIHANSARECLMRMENLFYFAGIADIPIKAIRHQICSAVNLIVQLERTHEGKRVISQVSELTQMEGDRITMSDLAIFEDGRLKFTGIVPTFMNEFIELGTNADFFN